MFSRKEFLLGQRLFDLRCFIPEMVAAVSSASSRSFSSWRFSSSLWCFLCSSSITFWWDSSIAAKPLSQVAYEMGKNAVQLWVHGLCGRGPKGSPKAGKTPGPYNVSQHRFPANNWQAAAFSHEQVEPVWVQKGLRGVTGYTTHWRNAWIIREESVWKYTLPFAVHSKASTDDNSTILIPNWACVVE